MNKAPSFSSKGSKNGPTPQDRKIKTTEERKRAFERKSSSFEQKYTTRQTDPKTKNNTPVMTKPDLTRLKTEDHNITSEMLLTVSASKNEESSFQQLASNSNNTKNPEPDEEFESCSESDYYVYHSD